MRTVIIDLQIILHFNFFDLSRFLAGLLADVWADVSADVCADSRAAVRFLLRSCPISAPVFRRLGYFLADSAAAVIRRLLSCYQRDREAPARRQALGPRYRSVVSALRSLHS